MLDHHFLNAVAESILLLGEVHGGSSSFSPEAKKGLPLNG
jgi:hypothetical protein